LKTQGGWPSAAAFESRRSDHLKAEYIGTEKPQIIEKSVVCGSLYAFLVSCYLEIRRHKCCQLFSANLAGGDCKRAIFRLE